MTLFALAASACGAGASAPTIDAISSEAVDLAAIDAAFDEWSEGVAGGGVGLIRFADGTEHLVDAGEDAASGDPLMAATDRVRVGSISKIFTAVMVMQLVEEGSVALDEPVSTYLDTPFDPQITVRHLLAHRSGIPNYTDSELFITRIIESPSAEATPEDIFTFVDGEPDFAPDEQYAYSNTNFVVAGQIVEAVTEQSITEVLDERINAPLGLSQTGFDDGSFDDVASGYSVVVPEGSSTRRDYTSIATMAWAAGSMVTTVPELATFLDAVYVTGQLLEAESVAEMTAALDEGEEYGLGTHPGADFGVGHGGIIIGFNSMAEIDPETGAMVIVVVNNDGRRPDVASGVLAKFLIG